MESPDKEKLMEMLRTLELPVKPLVYIMTGGEKLHCANNRQDENYVVASETQWDKTVMKQKVKNQITFRLCENCESQ